MMATRVSLLLLVTGLFAGMWSADGPDTRSAAQQQLARRGSSPRAMQLITARPSNRLLGLPVVPTPAKVIPLPKGITAGTYLIVDQHGRSERMTIDSKPSRSGRPSDQYLVRQGSNRWHFIRLQSPVEPRVAASGLPAPDSGLH